MSEWQPIETAPKDGRSIDLWVTIDHSGGQKWTGRFTDCYWTALGNSGADWVWDHVFLKEQGVTGISHWMPPPPPPPPAD